MYFYEFLPWIPEPGTQGNECHEFVFEKYQVFQEYKKFSLTKSDIRSRLQLRSSNIFKSKNKVRFCNTIASVALVHTLIQSD